MRILAIETSCDETAVAIVENGWKVHANVIASSLDLHKKTGGVVPEVAARAHIESMIPVLEEALEQMDPGKDREKQIALIDKIAVTTEPGLLPSLLVGMETAKWLAMLWEKPLVEVNHIHGHVFANWLERDPEEEQIQFPIVCLSVSGGHNDLIFMRSPSDWEILGQTQDDAAGEAFDKVARILGLGYPGGPEVEQQAELYVKMVPNLENDTFGIATGVEESLPEPSKGSLKQVRDDKKNSSNKPVLKFPRAWLNENNSNKWDGSSYDFSFSGLKSEALRQVQKRTKNDDLHLQDVAMISYAFQEAVVDALVTKLMGAAKKHEAKEIHIAGGVSANQFFRKVLRERSRELPIKLRYPKSLIYCTDNAAMIAAAAHLKSS